MIRYLWRILTRSGWNGVFGLIIFCTYVFMIKAQSREAAEILGNLLLAAGALIVGRGVTLEDKKRQWHFDFEKEQDAKPTNYLDVDAVKVQQLWLVRQLSNNVPLQQLEADLVAELSKAGYDTSSNPPSPPPRKELTPREISTSLRDASEYGEAGTVVIVAATLWLVSLLAYDILKHYQIFSLG